MKIDVHPSVTMTPGQREFIQRLLAVGPRTTMTQIHSGVTFQVIVTKAKVNQRGHLRLDIWFRDLDSIERWLQIPSWAGMGQPGAWHYTFERVNDED